MCLVGRDDELAAVERLLDDAGRRAGGALVLTGPHGIGKTAVLNAGAELAARLGFQVIRTAPPPAQPGRLVWARVVQELAGDGDLAAQVLADDDPLVLDAAARVLLSDRPRLIAVDDLDRGGVGAVAFLAVLASRLPGTSTAVLVAAEGPLGVTPELQLGRLTEEDTVALVGDLADEARHALWAASRGAPGLVRSLAAELGRLPPGQDPLVHLALHLPSDAGFLEVDDTLVRLLDDAVRRTDDDAVRARLLARRSAAVLGEASAAPRRRALADEALSLARRAGDPRALAEVLDGRLHALWDPEAAEDRLAAGSEIIDLARAAGEDALERHGLFWRFVALMELGRVDEAESALAAFERQAATAGDQRAAVMATARHAMLAVLRGRFDDAVRQTDVTIDGGRRVGLADADNIGGALRMAVAVERDLDAVAATLDVLMTMARRLPGHFYEATAARALSLLGRRTEAALELERVLPRVLRGSGPRWLGAMSDLAVAAATTGDETAAVRLHGALLPYRGRLVVLSGAATVWGPVSHYLGMLSALVGDLDAAVGHFEDAIALEEQVGALPYLAHSLAGLAPALERRAGDGDTQAAHGAWQRARATAERLGMTVLLRGLTSPADEWTLRRDGEDWVLEAGTEAARLRDGRGLHHLRSLLAAPARDIPALDLVGGGSGLVAPGAQPVLDEPARQAYRRRLAQLDAELDAADAAGDAVRAQRAETERQELLAVLRHASGLGGRLRRTSPEAERARVNVTRTLRATIDRIGAVAPDVGAHLRASVRTGTACRYDPAPGGPARWRV